MAGLGTMGTTYNSVQSPHPWAHRRGGLWYSPQGATVAVTPKIYIQKQLRFKHKMPITDNTAMASSMLRVIRP